MKRVSPARRFERMAASLRPLPKFKTGDVVRCPSMAFEPGTLFVVNLPKDEDGLYHIIQLVASAAFTANDYYADEDTLEMHHPSAFYRNEKRGGGNLVKPVAKRARKPRKLLTE